jgi:hypothetical protein
VVSLIDDARGVIYSFIVLATVITTVNYDHTVNMVVNYDRKISKKLPVFRPSLELNDSRKPT